MNWASSVTIGFQYYVDSYVYGSFMNQQEQGMPTVHITVPSIRPGEGNLEDLLRSAGLTVHLTPCAADISAADLAVRLLGCDIVVAGSERYTREVFERTPDLYHIARFGTGCDSIALDAATAHGVADAAGGNDWDGPDDPHVRNRSQSMCIEPECRLLVPPTAKTQATGRSRPGTTNPMPPFAAARPTGRAAVFFDNSTTI